MLSQSTAEFVVLCGFGLILILLGLLLMTSPRIFWRWDRHWLKNYQGYKGKNPPNNYDIRQKMGGVLMIGYGVTLIVAAMLVVQTTGIV